MKALFSKLLSPKDKIKTDDNSSKPEQSPLCFSVFESALNRWEKQGDENAPVWLNFYDANDALFAIEELKENYKITNTQLLGSVITVKESDIGKIIKIIRKMEQDKRLQLEIYKAVYEWKGSNPNRDDNSTFSMKFDTSGQAATARRSLAEGMNIEKVKTQDKTLSMPINSAEQFCSEFEKVHLESKYCAE